MRCLSYKAAVHQCLAFCPPPSLTLSQVEANAPLTPSHACHCSRKGCREASTAHLTSSHVPASYLLGMPLRYMCRRPLLHYGYRSSRPTRQVRLPSQAEERSALLPIHSLPLGLAYRAMSKETPIDRTQPSRKVKQYSITCRVSPIRDDADPHKTRANFVCLGPGSGCPCSRSFVDPRTSSPTGVVPFHTTAPLGLITTIAIVPVVYTLHTLTR
ncbi:hypothetical protein L210DRAFT_2767728 [Boletus edulis BED1]|uniref:Uncharacterized protein n=1 Tax=Boletus edulis BED1 TaxID=1328754 RepID=A0AAD4BKN0_BOLED|nr:hypothetical protein L210DRAFT_2767728 [Boletus edulis BED1]